MVGQLLEVNLLLGELLLELNELLLLTLADGVVLLGLLTALESITVQGKVFVSTLISGKWLCNAEP